MKTVCVMGSVSRANGGIFEAERRLQQQLHTKAGVEVHVLGLRDVQSETDAGAWWPLVPQTFAVRGPRAFGYAPQMGKALTECQADLAYLAGLWKYPTVAVAGWSAGAGKPVMVAPHGMLDPWALQNSGWKKKIVGALFQNEQLHRAACLRALCDSEARSFRAYGLKQPICIIPNGIDLPALSDGSERRHPRLPAKRKVLLYLGRLHPKKGLVPLLKAWSQAGAAGWVLAIAGWDQAGHEAELKRLATELGIRWTDGANPDTEEASVYFLGPQFGDDKEACYRSCDAFVLPSLSEGLPMVVLEAWAYGKPVLLTPECNLPEGIEAGAALPIKPTPAGVEAGLRLLFELSPEDRFSMGTKGRKLAEIRFDWEKIGMEAAAVYTWMIGGGTAPGCVELA